MMMLTTTASTGTPSQRQFTSNPTRSIKSLQYVSRPPALSHHRHRLISVQGVGKDAVTSWIDLAGFVASSGGNKTPYDSLADSIGRDVYIDVAGWHLYLKDVKLAPGGSLTMAQGLAAQLGAKVQSSRSIREDDVVEVISRVPVKLGQGKKTVALSDVLPSAGVYDLVKACEEYARDL